MIADLPWVMILSTWASCQTLVGVYLLTSKNRWGFVVSLLNQPVWVILALMTGAYGTLILSVAMVILAIRGWRKWK